MAENKKTEIKEIQTEEQVQHQKPDGILTDYSVVAEPPIPIK